MEPEAYGRQANEIDQDEASGNISDTDRRLLHDQLNNAAINQLYVQMLGEFSKPSCSNAAITDLYSGVKALQAKVPADQRLATLEQCYGKYEAIRRFVAGPVSFPIGFNGTSWKSLSDHQSAFRQKLNGYRNDAVYKQYLSNITELKSGLSGMEAKAAKEAAGYYRRLADQIYNHYCESADSEMTRATSPPCSAATPARPGKGRITANSTPSTSASIDENDETYIRSFADGRSALLRRSQGAARQRPRACRRGPLRHLLGRA